MAKPSDATTTDIMAVVDPTYIEMITSIFNLKQADLGMMIDLYKYQGFDPKFFRKFLALVEKDKKKLLDDMRTLMIVYLSRGTKIGGKMMVKTSIEGVKFLTELKTKYTILDTGKGASGMTDRSVTLGRIAAAYPETCAALLCSGQFKDQVMDVAKKPHASVPVYLKFAQGASLIPKVSTGLYDSWVKWSEDFNSIITGAINLKNEAEAEKEKRTAQVLKFAGIMNGSNLHNDSERANLSTEFEKRLALVATGKA